MVRNDIWSPKRNLIIIDRIIPEGPIDNNPAVL